MISFAHSFWTKPLLNNKFTDLRSALAINLVEYALSVEYIHKHGYKIVLYTDSIGAEIFAPIPYDNVIILENTITDNYHFAASFKFMALQNMSLEQILIDGDIFLHKPQVYKQIEKDNGDMLVSMFEPKVYIAHDRERTIKMLGILKQFNFEEPYETPEWKDCDGWYNTSLMKFNNEELKEEYIEQYKYYIDIVKDVDFQEIWPDIVLEQRHLTQLCRADKYRIHVVVKDFPSEKCNNEAIKIGFIHLGSAKQATQTQNVQILQTFNPELVIRLDRHISEMVAKYSK